jgi:hypothetical protein
VTREDFRRELGNAFDAISGSPSPALSDRVRSSLADVPERRGPIWIAGLAAAAMAALLIGVLLVANPLNRHQPVAPAVPAASPSASPATSPGPSPAASPSASPVSSPVASGPPYVCASSSIAAQGAPLSAYIDGVRTGTHTGYDRLTIEFQNGQPATIDVAPQSGSTFTLSPKGQPVTLKGQAGILVTIHGADAHTAYNGPTDFVTGYSVMVEVRQVQDFEGVVQYGIGLSNAACYRAFVLTNPARLVIDVQVG